MKDDIHELKLEIKSLKKGIDEINSKSSPDKNYYQELNIRNSFLEQQNYFFKKRNYIKTEYHWQILDIQSDQLKTNSIPKEKSDNMIDVNNVSIKGIAQGFSSSNTRIGITTDKKIKQP